MEATYRTAVDSVPEHYHPHQDEHFEVLASMVSIQIKGQERIYVAGESFDFPSNVPHRFLGAAGSEEARILWQLRPALDSAFGAVWFMTRLIYKDQQVAQSTK